MKIAILGAGNMGGAIARSLAKNENIDLWVSNPSQRRLDALKAEFPEISIANDNAEAVQDADVVILAVKPWLVESVLEALTLNPQKQMLVSIAAGVDFSQLSQYANGNAWAILEESDQNIPLFRVIPNTAIQQGQSMTLIAHHHATPEQVQTVESLFAPSGKTMIVPESQMDAGTALASCGIAFAMKYIQAAMQAGTELGLRPNQAQTLVAQSLIGAAEILLQTGNHPAIEIDRVCTPGGMTIRGINELEHSGFTSAIIRAMKATLCNTRE